MYLNTTRNPLTKQEAVQELGWPEDAWTLQALLKDVDCTKQCIEMAGEAVTAPQVAKDILVWLYLNCEAMDENLVQKKPLLEGLRRFYPQTPKIGANRTIRETFKEIWNERQEELRRQRDANLKARRARMTAEVMPSGLENLNSNLSVVVKELAHFHPSADVILNRDNLKVLAPAGKIELNGLQDLDGEFHVNACYESALKGIYHSYDKQCDTTHMDVLMHIVHTYELIKSRYKVCGVELFRMTVNAIINFIVSSGNRGALTMETVTRCANVIVTNAFEECYIFERTPAEKNKARKAPL